MRSNADDSADRYSTVTLTVTTEPEAQRGLPPSGDAEQGGRERELRH